MPENAETQAHLGAGMVAAYLDGGLSPSATAVVESHLEECATCRAEVVQVRHIVRPARSRRTIYLSAFAAAAALLLIVVSRIGSGPGDAARVPSDAIQRQLRELGRVVQAPVYLGVSVRAASEQGTQRFVAGMRAYSAARYDTAVTELRAARLAGVNGPAAAFFLAASQLCLGDAAEAAEAFAGVIALGQTQYLSEAHYYRAKALLQLGQFDNAVAELEQSASSGNESVQVIARSLRDSVRALRAP